MEKVLDDIGDTNNNNNEKEKDYNVVRENIKQFSFAHLCRQKKQLAQEARIRLYRQKVKEYISADNNNNNWGEEMEEEETIALDDATIYENNRQFVINDDSFSVVSPNGYFFMIPSTEYRAMCVNHTEEGKDCGHSYAYPDMVFFNSQRNEENMKQNNNNNNTVVSSNEGFYYGFAFYFYGKPLVDDYKNHKNHTGGYVLCLTSTSPVYRTLRKLTKDVVLLLCQEAISLIIIIIIIIKKASPLPFP
ncbi:hypothetical protein ADEAN_000773000 [Angomonas deanei]|uniref:Uncharacterized protein n=1 Tax=Angomonas deanei TaxID=59799 RepID=A0A7G2CLB9_9TRYP|nr:hypothetical protein ADEAN_000773000 [Angomonas deanei]